MKQLSVKLGLELCDNLDFKKAFGNYENLRLSIRHVNYVNYVDLISFLDSWISDQTINKFGKTITSYERLLNYWKKQEKFGKKFEYYSIMYVIFGKFK